MTRAAAILLATVALAACGGHAEHARPLTIEDLRRAARERPRDLGAQRDLAAAELLAVDGAAERAAPQIAKARALDPHDVRVAGEKRGTKQTLAMTDELLGWVQSIDPRLDLKYNKFYIGLAADGHPNNFVTFRPRRDWILMEIRLDRSDETQSRLEEAGIEVMEYGARGGQYRIRVTKADMSKNKDLLVDLFSRAHGSDE